MKRKYREYSDQDVIAAAISVKSIAGILRKLNLIPAGGNYIHMKKTLQRLEVDTSHWTGQAWNKGQQLKQYRDYTKNSYIKPHLIVKFGHMCNSCKLSEWLENPIPLELHHLNGDRTNNAEENLELLCPNCHSLTENWRGRK
jgi:hypothetical protein